MTSLILDRRSLLAGMAATAALPSLAAAAPNAPASFLVVGDWGRDGAQHQRDVAVQMGKLAQAQRSRFVVSVGDNFYDNGVQSVSDPQWQSSYEQVYTDPALQVPWYVALGNHDYRGNPQAQLDYARTSPRWHMPQRYYQVSGAQAGAAQIDLFVIDTSPTVHKYRDKVDSVIARNIATQDVGAQLAWLDKALAASTARWKLVIGHHTIRSGGSGHGETPEMVEQVLPILQRRGVTAYIFGHDHDLQHIARDGLHYIGCGGGSEVRPVAKVEGTRFCAERSGFAAMTVGASGLSLEFTDYTGASLYRSMIAS
ncbi:purple acid phosphatase family protein [Novosphingobium sp.]|uniref:purple acid phosphatase family protein n=1 Tax=Novosphingobium sp. TaxID=1874826 RepID=UPI003BA9DA44